MKQQVFYIHGGEAFDTYERFLHRLKTKEIWDLPSAPAFSKWTNTLAEDLGDAYEVFMPKMPNAQNAKYDEWKIWFERHFEYLHYDVVLIGHSLGAMFLTRYVVENTPPFTVKLLILMAGVVESDVLEDEDCGDFVFSLDDTHILAEKAEKVVIMHSKDDFVVPFSHGERLHKAVPNAKFMAFEDKNHFLVEEFPEILDVIRNAG